MFKCSMNENILEKLQTILKEYKKQVDFLSFNLLEKKQNTSEYNIIKQDKSRNGVVKKIINFLFNSDFKVQKEFNITEKKQTINVHIINKKKEYHFSCNDIKNLKQEIENAIKEMENFTEDSDLVIPKSLKITASDVNDSIKYSHKEIFSHIYNSTKQNFTFPRFFSTIEISQTEKVITNLNSLGFCYTLINKCNYVMNEIIAIDEDKRYTEFMFWNGKSKQKNEKFVKQQFESLKKQVNAKQINGEFQCVFTNAVASRILEKTLNLLYGENISNGTSYFKDKLNKKIFSTDISIISQPVSKYYKQQYDEEGLKLTEYNLIEKGVLKNFILNSKYAKKLKKATSGDNLLIIESDHQKKIKSFMDGVVITELISCNLNPIKGDFKASAIGQQIINGKETPVNNIVFSFNLKDFLKMELCDDDLYEEGKIITPSIFIPKIII